MEIRVSGHQVDVGDTLTANVHDRLQAIADKYFARAISAHATFGKGPHDNGFTCDIVAHVIKGLVLKGRHDAQEAQVAFNGAADRIEKQLRRYVRRLKEHKADPAAYVENAGYTVFSPANEDHEEAPDSPVIVAETRVDIPETSVSDAVMLMDLRNTTALMSKNSATGEFNMIYRREDGNIGWVEPHTD